MVCFLRPFPCISFSRPFIPLISSTEHSLITRDSNDNHSRGQSASSTQVSGGYICSSTSSSSSSLHSQSQPQQLLPPLEPSHDFSVDSNSCSASPCPSSSSPVSCSSSPAPPAKSSSTNVSPPVKDKTRVVTDHDHNSSDYNYDENPPANHSLGMRRGSNVSQNKANYRRVKRNDVETSVSQPSVSPMSRSNATKYSIDELLKDSNRKSQESATDHLMLPNNLPGRSIPAPFPQFQVNLDSSPYNS